MPLLPPKVSITATLRELYLSGAFAQRELIGDGRFRSSAAERGVRLGIGHRALEELDAAGALRPLAFSLTGYWTGFSSPAEDPDTMRFTDEVEPGGWDQHHWEHELERGLPNITALYSPWQLLYVERAGSDKTLSVSLDVLLMPAAEREDVFEQWRATFDRTRGEWAGLHDAWSGLIALLVGVQNRYWPSVSERLTLVPTKAGGYDRAGPPPDAETVEQLLERLGCSRDEVLAAYHFLVERGLRDDPQDGLTLLRRARPRAFVSRWRGSPRRAQDCFDAAEMLRLFLAELDGEQPPRVPHWPLDGRQPERAALYDRGPGAPWSRDEIKTELLSAELYPHGVHVIGEGASEQIVVERVVEHLLGSAALHEIEFFDLGGSGSAKHVEPLAKSFGDYAVRAFVIVDREGQMAEYLKAAIARESLDEADVLLFRDSLEADNSWPAELIGLVREIGASLAEDEAPAFELEPEELEALHADRVSRSSRNDRPGLADTLLREVRRRTDAALDIEKLDLVEALAGRIMDDLDAMQGEEGEKELVARRPIVGFLLDRVIPAINRPRPLGRE